MEKNHNLNSSYVVIGIYNRKLFVRFFSARSLISMRRIDAAKLSKIDRIIEKNGLLNVDRSLPTR